MEHPFGRVHVISIPNIYYYLLESTYIYYITSLSNPSSYCRDVGTWMSAFMLGCLRRQMRSFTAARREGGNISKKSSSRALKGSSTRRLASIGHVSCGARSANKMPKKANTLPMKTRKRPPEHGHKGRI